MGGLGGLSRFNAGRMNSSRDNQRVAERALDSNDLERERGIAIPSGAAKRNKSRIYLSEKHEQC
jgi:predicted membrane GTPase involved in stress response